MSSRSSDPLQGRLLDGRYLVGSRIARGGMATVYAATDTRLDRLVAVKVMHPGLGDDGEVAARFVREARSAARLNHPNVVAMFDQGADDGLVFLVMEHVPGATLRDVVRDESPLSPRRALALLEQVLTALAAAHAGGIVHRDVKPENVLLAPDGRVKVTDFGLARAVSTATSATAVSGPLIGTVAYLAPELVLDDGADARSDVYAAGVMLYELLTGLKPHAGGTPLQVAYQHVHRDVPAPSRHVPGLPDYIDALVERATARDRAVRPADAQVLLHQVRRVRGAVDQGLSGDPDLAADLRPHRSPGPAEADGGAEADQSGEVTEVTGRRTGPASPPPAVPYDWAADPAGWSQQDTEPGASAGTGTVVVPADPASAGNTPRRPRRRRRLLAISALTVAVVLLAGWYVALGRWTTTPALAGMSRAEAGAAAERAGLEVTLGGKDFSDTVPAGDVLRTDPDRDERIARGDTVALVLSAGAERYEVPDVAGLAVDTAEQRLRATRLSTGAVRERWSDRYAEGTVVAQGTDAGTSVPVDTGVDLVVSRGPRPLEVPDHTGDPVRVAAVDLRETGFVVEVAQKVFDDTVPAGNVLSQTPSSGTGYRGDTVELVVSKGPELVSVPDVVATGVVAARETLEEAGFDVEERRSATYIGLGYVVAQSPSSDELVPPGSTIVLSLV